MMLYFSIRFNRAENARRWFIIRKKVNRVLARMQATFTRDHLAIVRIFLTFFVLEIIGALHILVERLERLDWHYFCSFTFVNLPFFRQYHVSALIFLPSTLIDLTDFRSDQSLLYSDRTIQHPSGARALFFGPIAIETEFFDFISSVVFISDKQ
jgi:hypothetical protein